VPPAGTLGPVACCSGHPDGAERADLIAIVAITRSGARLAAKLAPALPGARAYVAPRWQKEAGPDAEPLRASLGAEIARLFSVSDGLVIVAAVGVVVRLVAPCLRDKTRDPGVVAIDDAGRYAVSVVSGHLGGANALTRRVAGILGAEPIITTASEAHGLPAVDLLGQQWGWRVDNPAAAKRVSAALINGEPVGVVQDAGETTWWPATAPALQVFASVEALAAAGLPAIAVTDRLVPESLTATGAQWVIFRPRTLVLGIGASSGAPGAEIEGLARATLAAAGLAWDSLALVATLDRKLAEPGILAFAGRVSLPLQGYTPEELREVPVPHPSVVVEGHVGTPSVCEAAAVLAAGGGPLVAAKRKSPHATVAVARRAETPAASSPEITTASGR
jgi:cobalt-precorrin 5A hydrolase